MDTSGTDALFARARAGDDSAWDELVEMYSPLLRSIARRYRLSAHDVADVVQTTWMRLFQKVDHIDDPRRLVGWLSTTVRRECWRLSGRRTRELPVADDMEWRAHPDPGPEVAIVTEDLAVRVNRAIDDLPERQRTLLRALMSDPAPSYGEIAETLHMPIGSIGPTRARALAGLRRSGLLAEPSYAA